MLHALPALLDDLENRLIAGEDPMPVIAGVRWQEVIGWPSERGEALRLRDRLKNLQILISALESPIRATLMAANQGGTYAPRGGVPLPATVSVRIQHHV